MKNITIGNTLSNQKAAALTRYYAVRGDEVEYGFGTTPADALANLERRDGAVRTKFDDGLFEEVAFLALGAGECLRDARPPRTLDKFSGYMGVINEVVRCAPLLAQRGRDMAGEFEGVWLYDVTERFGREWAEALLEGRPESPEEFLEYIITDEMEKWA